MKNKNKKTRKMKATVTKKGGTVLGSGSEGCIIDSFSCGDYTIQNGYVAKIVKKNVIDNYDKIHEILIKIDPYEERFALYQIKRNYECSLPSPTDIIDCEKKMKSPLDTERILITKLLHPIIDNKKLTKTQYRYLRKSLEILRDNGIHHGDLPDNVMLNPDTNLPIIIDWGHQSRLMTVNDSARDFDYNIFMQNYRT
jgi:tRNA A-37 threonylcarbamoyl transferase component Bud32